MSPSATGSRRVEWGVAARVVLIKEGKDTAYPGGAVDESGNGSLSWGVVEDGEGARELGDDTISPLLLSTTLSNY